MQALNFVLVGLGNSDKFKATYNPEETGDEKLIEAIKAMGKVYILSGLEDNDKRLDFAEKTYGKHLSRHYIASTI